MTPMALTLMSCGAVNTGIALRLSCLSVSSCSGRVSWCSRKRSCSAMAGDQGHNGISLLPSSLKRKLKPTSSKGKSLLPQSPEGWPLTTYPSLHTTDLLFDLRPQQHKVSAERECLFRRWAPRYRPHFRAAQCRSMAAASLGNGVGPGSHGETDPLPSIFSCSVSSERSEANAASLLKPRRVFFFAK